MKKLLFILSLALLGFACNQSSNLYSFYRVYFNNTYTTRTGFVLKTEANPDQIAKFNGKDLITPFSAKVQGSFTFSYDTIIQYGHVWSLSNPNPYISSSDTSHFSKFYNWTPGKQGDFVSTVSGLKPGHVFYVRSYIITSHHDTGYNPIVLKDSTPELENKWYICPNFPGPARAGAVATKYYDNQKNTDIAIFGTGYNANSTLNDIWQYNPKNKTWVQMPNYPFNLCHAVAVSVTYKDLRGYTHTKIYIGTGATDKNDYNKVNVWKEFNFSEFSWQSTNCGFYFPYKVSGAVAFTIGQYAYIGLGKLVNGQISNKFFKFNPALADSIGGYPWSQIANFDSAYASYGATAFVINQNGYVLTGQLQNGKIINALFEYIPQQDTWIRKADLIAPPVYLACAFTINSFAYVGTGLKNPTAASALFFRYDPYLNSWSQSTDYMIGPNYTGQNNAVADAVALTLNSKGWVGSGFYFSNSVKQFSKLFFEYEAW